MSKLLIFIGENQQFDLPLTVAAITSLPGVSNARTGVFIGAVFECNYSARERTTVVRISDDLETVTVEGIGDDSLDFAVQFQKAMSTPLNVIDMEYTFNLGLSNFQSAFDLKTAIQES